MTEHQSEAQPENNGGDKEESLSGTVTGLLGYGLLGVFFGIVLTKSEVVSWFRIQEMFRFEAFHMYGVIGSAVVVASVSIQAIKTWNIPTVYGEEINIPDKKWFRYRYGIGGILFGFGWALLGACPGPIYALIGAGYPVVIVALISALAGAWTYGLLKPYLPH